MSNEKTLAQGWVDDPPPQSRCPVRAWLGRGGHPSALASLCGPSLGPVGHRATLTAADCCPAVSAAYARAPSIAVARHFPGHQAALPGEECEWLVHQRSIYPIPQFTGLCCVVPPRPREVSLVCPSCSSPRRTVAGFLQTPPHGDARALDSSFSSGILRLMKVNLLPGTCTPTSRPCRAYTIASSTTAARERFWMNVNRHGRAAAAEAETLGHRP
jgi:hypothetical protein